jgi:biopolymer transport protein ExbB
MNLLLNDTMQISLLELLMKGGWLMVPLLLFSLITVYIFFDRYFFIRKQQRIDDNFFERFTGLVKTEKIESATALCESVNCSESRILMKGLQSLGQPVAEIRNQMESEGKLEVYKYEENLYFLGVIAGVAPMMGFIGTIVGVIKIFYNISLADDISISLISGGLYQKLITSGVGLSIGIVAFIAYHFLDHRVNKLVQKWEYYSVRFIDIINNPNK